MPGFDLRRIVLDVLHDTDLNHPDAIAAEVLARIPRNRTREALAEALPEYVASVHLPVPAPKQVRRAVKPPTATQQTSAKVEGIRAAWQNRLLAKVHVGAGKHKTLGECTYQDLLFASNERARLAQFNQAEARKFAAWARLVARAEVQTLADVPATELAHALG